MRDALDAARKFERSMEIVYASSEAEIDAAFDKLREVRAGAMLVQADAFLVNNRRDRVACCPRCGPSDVLGP